MLLIDHLGAGGAQRQISLLAKLLKQQGVEVVVVIYHLDAFYESELDEAGVPVERIRKGGRFSRVIYIRSFIRAWQPDAVVAFMDTPSVLAELSSLPTRRFAVIVSERSGKVGPTSLKDKIRLRFHYLADAIVTNAVHLKEFVIDNCPRLENRVHVIHNCVEVEKFACEISAREDREPFEIVTVGRYRPEKNPVNLCEAMALLAKRDTKPNIKLTWYGDTFFNDGKPSRFSDTYLDLQKRVSDAGLDSSFVLKPKTKDVAAIYKSSDAVCLASFYEGFSNVLGEAVASGKPVLASRVCDNPILVRDNLNGFLFNPYSSEEIADAFQKIAAQSTERLNEMGRQSRNIALEILSPDHFANAYLELIETVSRQYRKKVKMK